jgi:hypothetical protein
MQLVPADPRSTLFNPRHRQSAVRISGSLVVQAQTWTSLLDLHRPHEDMLAATSPSLVSLARALAWCSRVVHGPSVLSLASLRHLWSAVHNLKTLQTCFFSKDWRSSAWLDMTSSCEFRTSSRRLHQEAGSSWSYARG